MRHGYFYLHENITMDNLVSRYSHEICGSYIVVVIAHSQIDGRVNHLLIFTR